MSLDIITLYAIAFEYINNDKATMDFLAGKYAVSKTTINRYLNGRAGVWLDPETQKQVLETKKARWLAAKKTCGNLGHKKISTDKARELAGKLVEEGLTLKRLINNYKITANNGEDVTNRVKALMEYYDKLEEYAKAFINNANNK